MKKLFSIILFVCAFTSLIAAPVPGGIRGVIHDAGTREPLEFVNVSVKEKQSGEFAGGCPSDETGTFLVEGLKAGDYVVSVSFMGYKTVERNVTVRATVVNIGRINLEEDSKLINEVQVVGQQSTMNSTSTAKCSTWHRTSPPKALPHRICSKTSLRSRLTTKVPYP
ncbi:MAG: carboxypeptidase-like regulatory domain-containing protein [Bacteroidales bacterium]|nr:carboxypeptidase-like regulatory domain-containing protein [Bacteroidales bacterium]